MSGRVLCIVVSEFTPKFADMLMLNAGSLTVWKLGHLKSASCDETM